MKVTSGGVSLSYFASPKAGGVCIAIGWKCPSLNWFVLNKLKRAEQCSCPTLAPGSEMTAVAYSVYLNIYDKLMRDPKATQDSKVAGVSCNYQNGEFFVCIRSGSTFSGIRKALVLTAKALTPTKLYQTYASCIRLLNGKPSRDEFDHCSGVISGHVQSLNCVVVGKVKIADDNLKVLVETVAAAIPDSVKPSGSKPESGEPSAETSYPTVPAKGVAAVLVADFVLSMIPDPVTVHSDVVIVKKLGWKAPKVESDKIERWTNSRFGKLENIPVATAFAGLATCQMNPELAAKVGSGSLTVKDIVGHIKEAF